MALLVHVLTLGLCIWLTAGLYGETLSNEETPRNSSRANKDMYVIHATVYEVGILTNKTGSNNTNPKSMGTQESLTFFHTNGTKMDISGIPKPLITNITTHSIVSVAPVNNITTHQIGSWDALNKIASLKNPTSVAKSGNTSISSATIPNETVMNPIHKRSLEDFILMKRIFRRNVNGSIVAKIENGSTVIPPEAGVTYLGLPQLLSLNNNLSHIPVPIPNNSVIKYTKVNTLVRPP